MSGRLVFNSFSVIWSQMFTLNRCFEPKRMLKGCRIDDDATRLDKELFENYIPGQNHLLRYILPDLNVRISLMPASESQDATLIYGRVYVRATIYYERTVCISYRFMVDRRKSDLKNPKYFRAISDHCHTNRALQLDDIIVLAGAPVGNEHWQTCKSSEISYRVTGNIQTIIASIGGEDICQSLIPDDGNLPAGKVLSNLFSYYRDEVLNQETDKVGFCGPNKNFIIGINESTFLRDYIPLQNAFYSLVDVWEDIEHTCTPNFKDLSEKDIIDHIQCDHQKELIGLLTLYPEEWLYRREALFESICGCNMGLDNDDLILLSGSVCLIIGTYGRREMVEEGVQWGSVLNRTRSLFHMSYQEYYFVLDLILAKRHAIKSATYIATTYLDKLSTFSKQDSIIQSLCELFLETSRGIMKLDILKYSRFEALRIQAEQIEKKLGIPEAYQEISGLLNRLDGAIKTIDGFREQKRKRNLSQLLMIISIAAILGIIFDEPKFALLRDLLGWMRKSGIVHIPGSEQAWALFCAELIIAFIMVLILYFGIKHLLSIIFNLFKEKKHV